MELYAKNMGDKVVLYKHVTLTPYTQVQVKVVTKCFGLFHTETFRYLWNGRPFLGANGIHWVVTNKLLKILLTSFTGIEKNLPRGTATSYATRSPAIHFAVSGTMVTEICEWVSEFNGGRSNGCGHKSAMNQSHRPEFCRSRWGHPIF